MKTGCLCGSKTLATAHSTPANFSTTMTSIIGIVRTHLGGLPQTSSLIHTHTSISTQHTRGTKTNPSATKASIPPMYSPQKPMDYYRKVLMPKNLSSWQLLQLLLTQTFIWERHQATNWESSKISWLRRQFLQRGTSTYSPMPKFREKPTSIQTR